ncbi:MAG: hypothetical protein HKN72_15165, partial [Gemmatimonadetes bacterium]|nr:hypothetical protein [Gemmatimonadota bacterium]
SMDDGTTWEKFQYDLPRTPITDMKIHQGDLVLSTMGRGFWIMDNLSPLRQAAAAMAEDVYFFEPVDAYRLRGGGFGGFGQAGPDEPQYSPVGAMLDYMLPAGVRSVELSIHDGSGEMIRLYESEGPGVSTERAQEMRAPFFQTRGAPSPGTKAGLNRFVWDLTVPGPGGAARGGPMVVPGQYTASLTVDGETHERSFNVLMDPRVAADGVTVADLQEQFDLALEIQAAIEDADQTIERLRGVQERVSEGTDVERQLKEIERALLTDDSISSYPQPMLRDQFNYLYRNSISADQEPAVDMYDRLEALVTELEEHKSQLERLSRMVTDG